MRQINNKGFSLVELLVVITILAIISVVAYQNFGGATDKAISGRKINDIGTIETALQQFKADNNYYPMPATYDAASNKWGYTGAYVAYPSNTLDVSYNGKEINTVDSGSGWGIVYGTGTNGSYQVGAKWVISQNDLGKKYLSKDLYDPEIGDIVVKSTSKKMIDSGIGRYVYWVYAQPRTVAIWNKVGNGATYYNIATSIKQKDSDKYETYLVWDYDKNSCQDPTGCPDSLVGTASGSTVSPAQNTTLQNKSVQNINELSTSANQWIPYPVKDFQ